MAGEREGLFRRRRTGGRREHRTVIKHSDEEWARVQSLAQAQGVSVPRLYERSLHAGDVVAASKLTTVYGELLIVQRIMGNAANNLNQAAKVANSTSEIHGEQILAAADLMRRQADRVFELMQEIPGGRDFYPSDRV